MKRDSKDSISCFHEEAEENIDMEKLMMGMEAMCHVNGNLDCEDLRA